MKKNMGENKVKSSLQRLKSIVSWFDDQEEVDIEEGLEKVKEGAKIVKESREKLKKLENEFEKIKEELGN